MNAVFLAFVKFIKEPTRPIMVLLSLAAIIIGGGYSLDWFSWMKLGYSLALFFLEGAMALALLLIDCHQGADSDFSAKALQIVIIAVVAIVTVIICALHLQWPKTSAGIGAIINLAIYALLYLSYLDEKRQVSAKTV